MNAEHALAAAFFFEVAYPDVQQIFERDDVHEFSRLLIIDHRKPREPGIRHAVHHHAQWLMGIRHYWISLHHIA